jgi:arylsulfatase A-like enzyme
MIEGESGVRVPLLIAGSGIKANHQSDAFAYVRDVMTTLLEMAGVEYPAEFNRRKLE